jgi:ATP-dependent DNA helicase RecQ
MPVLATTATANQRVTTDVAEQLGGQVLTLRGPLDRDSLVLSVLRLPRQAHRLAWLATHLPTLPGSGIVYGLTVDDTKHVADWLTAHGVDAVAYSGRDDNSERERIEQALHANTLKAVVATSALGMGFDKPDLAFVVHFQAPNSPIAYYQQIGRAGRALDRAEIVLLHGAEDQHIWNYFATTAFPARQRVLTVLKLLSAADGPLRLNKIEAAVDLSRNRLQHMLKVLEVEGAVRRTPAGWEPTDAPWTYDEQRYARVTAARRAEQDAMLTYTNVDSCLMVYLRRQLDDPQASDCGRCANCTGERPIPTLDPELVGAAQHFLDRQHVVVEPRQRWPYAVDGLEGPIPAEQQVEPGRALARANTPGWGNALRELLLADDQPVPAHVLSAVGRLLDRWDWPAPPTWVTFVPSRRHPQLVESLAQQVASACGVSLTSVVRRVRDGAYQAELANGSHLCRNLHNAFAIHGPLPDGPVLLVDDLADSRWTLTVVGAALRQAGASAVLPLVLVAGR